MSPWIAALIALTTASAGAPDDGVRAKGASDVSTLEPADLVGTWALEMVGVTAARVAVVGRVKSTARTGVLVHLSQNEDGTWVQLHQPCGSVITGGSIIKTRMPESYYESIPQKVLAPVVRSTPEGLSFDVDVRLFVAGWDPAACDAVPSEPDDPCVRDWDSDGKPGVTIHVKAPLFPWVEVYVSQQTHPALVGGLATSADRVEGSLQVTEMDNHVLDASNRLFVANPVTRMLDTESTFAMSRLPDTATCAEVLEVLEIDPGW